CTLNNSRYLTRPLSPAGISAVKVDGENKTAAVYLQPDQVCLAGGRGGRKIQLAGELTGHESDVDRETDVAAEDVDSDEVAEEVGGWSIDELKRVGLDTAKSVLALSEEELVRRTDLEEDTVHEIVRILQAEFE